MLTRSATLGPGDPAPEFTLPDNQGVPRSLSTYLARGPVILAFHRGTW